MNFDNFILQNCPALVPNQVKTHDPEDDVFKLIGETIAEIDQEGRPWVGFHETLTATDRQVLRDAEASIDTAALRNDGDGAIKSLDAYRDLIADIRRKHAIDTEKKSLAC